MFKKIATEKIFLSIIVIMGGLVMLKKVKNNNLEGFKKEEFKLTKEQIKLNALAKLLDLDTVKEIAKKLNIKRKINKENKVNVFLDIIKQYEKAIKDLNTLKEQKTQLQLEEITKKDKSDIKDFNESLKDYLEYQKSQNKKIDLLQLGNDVDSGIKNLLNYVNDIMKKKKEKEKKKSKFEGFQVNTE